MPLPYQDAEFLKFTQIVIAWRHRSVIFRAPFAFQAIPGTFFTLNADY